ncbi:MAG: transketolase [Candidatus Omnitrophota bacterium]|nr:transketolase [Candidatus Omnitrophota bacterium]
MVLSNEDLKSKAQKIRQEIFKMICGAGGGHTPSCLSIVEILVILYNDVLRVNFKEPHDPDRDRFILSKGHSGVALYAILADKGFFDPKFLLTHGKKGTILGGHPDMHKIPGVEASTGALGHGLAFGAGIALAAKKDAKAYRTFVILGDGECQEGSVWEAALFAPQMKLDNLTVIIDHNKFQAMDRLDDIIGLAPLVEKWKVFGWAVEEVDGHDIGALQALFQRLPFTKGKPSCVIAHTVKGKGISFMENVSLWHYRQPKPDEIGVACKDLGILESELELFVQKK